jgi:hypothetical protein
MHPTSGYTQSRGLGSRADFLDRLKGFGKQDFRYLVEEDVYVCPAGEGLRRAAPIH